MSATVKAIHTLLVTLSAAELCEVIQRSAELCAELSQKSLAPATALASVSATATATALASVSATATATSAVPASARMKRPTSVSHPESEAKHIEAKHIEAKHTDIPKRFANLLGWDDSDESASMASAAADTESDSDESTDHVKKRRTMKKCFTDGQRIRHRMRDKMWIGTYDSSKNAIVHNGTTYRTISMFATAHVIADHNPNRAAPRDGWRYCECEVQGEWVSTYEIPC